MERMVGIRHIRWWLTRRKMARFLEGHEAAAQVRLGALFATTLDAIWRGAR